MADEELDLDLGDSTDTEDQQINPVEKRIKDLSGKVRIASDERDKAHKATEKALAEKDAALKDLEFFKTFLAKEGKFTPPPVAEPVQDSPIGGSSTTTVKSGTKALADMTPEEKRKILEDTMGMS